MKWFKRKTEVVCNSCDKSFMLDKSRIVPGIEILCNDCISKLGDEFRKMKEANGTVNICIWCGCYYYTESGEYLEFRTTPIIDAVEKGLCNDCIKLKLEYDEKRLKELGYKVVRVDGGWKEVE